MRLSAIATPLCWIACSLGSLAAQAEPLMAVQAHDAKGQAFDMHKLDGKVSLLYYWSTGCAVCRDSLPELRANALGWRSKPFLLVTLNVDKQERDWAAYEQIASQTLRNPPPGLLSLRSEGAPPPRLPLMLVVDARGEVKARYEGRVAAEAWDAVAGLLP